MKPLILEYAVKRKGEIKTFYKYDYSASLNIIEVENTKRAYIDSDSNDIALLTKTRVRSESDDADINGLELRTKTEVNQERDDDHKLMLDLATKTLVSQERDDENFNYHQ